jgi:nucleoside-specific outer membrane channel protein Tsx
LDASQKTSPGHIKGRARPSGRKITAGTSFGPLKELFFTWSFIYGMKKYFFLTNCCTLFVYLFI